MGLSITRDRASGQIIPSLARGPRAVSGSLAFDASYPTGGEAITAAALGFARSLNRMIIDTYGGHTFQFDKANLKVKAFKGSAVPARTGTIDDNDAAATLGHALYVVPQATAPRAVVLQAEASATGLIHDDDAAASAGVQVYIVADNPDWSPVYALGHLEFVSPTNANGTCTIATGDDTLTLFDDDGAASNGDIVNAIAAGAGLEFEQINNANKPIIVPTSLGNYILFVSGTTGVNVYFDEDAGSTFERVMGVIVDNADEPYDLLVGAVAATETIPTAIDLSSRFASIVTVGPKGFTYAVGSGGPELTIPSRPDAATLPGAVALGIIAAGAGFDAALPGLEDVFVPLSNGEFVKVAYAASPAGVQVYGYPEGASADLTILCVVVDNADEPFTVHTGFAMDRGEVDSGTDLSSVAPGYIAIGE